MTARALLVGGLCAMWLAGLSVGWLWPERIVASGAELFDSLRNLGLAGMLAFALAQTAVAVTGLLPAALLGVVAGAVYGLSKGFVIAAASTMLGGVLGFLIARTTLRGLVEPIFARRPALKDYDAFVARDGWRSVCLLRISPVTPFAMTSYALGLSSIGMRDYVVGTLASLPALFAYVFLGKLANANLTTWSAGAGPLRWALLAVGVVAFLVFTLRLGRARQTSRAGDRYRVVVDQLGGDIRKRIVELSSVLSLTRRPIVAWGALLLILQILLLAFLVAGSYGIGPQYGPNAVSFVSFYAAGDLANGGHPALAYDETFHYLAEETLIKPGIHYIPFLYPPVYLLICAPLALLPPLAAVALFEAATLIFYLVVVQRILGERGSAWLLPALAFPATFWTIGYGQNAFLSAALIGAGTLLVDRRPLLAGALFGMLCYKPTFALLVPVALIAGGRWSAIVGAAVSAIVLIGLSIALFGIETWQAYLHSFIGSKATYDFEFAEANSFGIISPFAAARFLGLSVAHARIAQLAATLAAALVVGWVWTTAANRALRGATLASGALIAAPYALLYDLTIAAIGASWMIRAGRESGFLAWEKAGLAAVYVLPLFALQAGLYLHLPLSPLPAAIMALLVGSRVLQKYETRRAQAAGVAAT